MKKSLFLISFLLLGLTTSCAKKAEASSQEETKTEATATENTTAVVKKVDANLTGAAAFEEIKKNYAGKVVLFDFWATWCPPCRSAMTQMHDIKPALMSKGAQFVYITGETSPEADWKQMIPSIAGDHYRLTNQQWQELGSLLKMQGIPAYLILNKDGSEAFSNITSGGYPGNEIIQNNIEVALSK